MDEVPYLETRGSAYERGEQHGRAFREQIAYAIEQWRCPDPSDIRTGRLVARSIAYLQDHYPEIIGEIRGIAQGAHLRFDDVFWLTAFNAIGRISAPTPPHGTTQRCTGIVLRNDVAISLGKTTDIDQKQRKQYLLQKAVTETGASYLSLRWIGNVWTEVGLNNFGLAVGANSGPVIMAGQDGYGLPQHTMLSVVLERCRDVEQGIALLGQTIMTGKGLNIVLADAHGQAAVVEKSFDRQGVIHMPDGARAIFTTNHCVTDVLRDTARMPNSLRRYANLKGLLGGPLAKPPGEMMEDVLANHSEPGAVCQHGQDGMFTLITCIASPKEGTLLVNGSSGCARGYRAYRV